MTFSADWNRTDLKEALSIEITSKDLWFDIANHYGFLLEACAPIAGSCAPRAQGRFTTDDNWHRWFLAREQVRIDRSVYKTSEVLDWLNSCLPIAAHIHPEDKALVRYTPSVEMGEKDRRITTTLGRLLKKLYPMSEDHTVEDIVTSHMAEVNAECEFLQGSAIVEAYTAGPHSCMKEKRVYSHVDGLEHHPAEVYDHPNIACAVLRNADGKISARCMVRLEEKVFIRNYGSSALRKILLSKGFKSGSWVGQEFKTIEKEKVNSEFSTYVFPYLDAFDSTASSESCSIAVINGIIRCLESKHHRKIRDLGGTVVLAARDRGYTDSMQRATVKSEATDYITGLPINLIFDDVVKVWVDGAVKLTTSENFNSLEQFHVSTRSETHGNDVYALREMCFLRSYSYVIDCEDTRKEFGYVKLDETLYPEDREWYRREGGRLQIVTTRTEALIKSTDAVVWVDEKNVPYRIHKTEVPISRAEKVILKPHEGRKVFAHPKADVLITDSGVKVHGRVHDLVTLWDGTVVFKRTAQGVRRFGYHFFVKRGSLVEVLVSEQFAKHVVKRISEYHGLEFTFNKVEAYAMALATTVGVSAVHYDSENSTWIDCRKLRSKPFDYQLKAMRLMLTQQEVADTLGTNVASILRQEFNNWVAEATAVDYN